MDVFVYGTLTEPDRVREVLDSFAFVGAARLEGLRVVEGRYPALAPPVEAGNAGDGTDGDAGTNGGDGVAGDDSVCGDDIGVDATVGGRLLRTDEMAALDAYERVDDGLYVRVSVPLVGPDGERRGEAAVYVGDPARLDAPASWPGSDPFEERVARTVRERGVTVRVQPQG
ncbi:gamma-glutamylcyclotransferase family protein [Halobaculum magnesiiphilum]|uniref:Gamma-glutamylcyclotransferase n=1 Tax=Halobaculum magnesiiphilum TaxID=1017351 RepID=A0A8T8WAX5_9EURY|nr:gamma-glutamylcyclotransferase family protein [Halobaculum magnesiiphilum]QZP36976.1 gamma-glutamylcyclotransferase [Halobaculum magnesiiphilum]